MMFKIFLKRAVFLLLALLLCLSACRPAAPAEEGGASEPEPDQAPSPELDGETGWIFTAFSAGEALEAYAEWEEPFCVFDPTAATPAPSEKTLTLSFDVESSVAHVERVYKKPLELSEDDARLAASLVDVTLWSNEDIELKENFNDHYLLGQHFGAEGYKFDLIESEQEAVGTAQYSVTPEKFPESMEERYRFELLRIYVVYSEYGNYAAALTFDPVSTGVYLDDADACRRGICLSLRNRLNALDTAELVQERFGAVKTFSYDQVHRADPYTAGMISSETEPVAQVRVVLPETDVRFLMFLPDSGEKDLTDSEQTKDGLSMSVFVKTPTEEHVQYDSFENPLAVAAKRPVKRPGDWVVSKAFQTEDGLSVYQIRENTLEHYQSLYGYVIYAADHSFAVYVEFFPVNSQNRVCDEANTYDALIESMQFIKVA